MPGARRAAEPAQVRSCSARRGTISTSPTRATSASARIDADRRSSTTVAGNGDRAASAATAAARGGAVQRSRGRTTTPSRAAASPLDGEGRLYIADTYNHRIRRIDFAADMIDDRRRQRHGRLRGRRRPGDRGVAQPRRATSSSAPTAASTSPTPTTTASAPSTSTTGSSPPSPATATRGFGGDGGAADGGRRCSGPFGIAFDRAGNLYVADTFNNRIRQGDAMTATARSASLAGWPLAALAAAAAAAATTASRRRCRRMRRRRPAPSARSPATAWPATAPTTWRRWRPRSTLPQDIAFAPDGALYIVDWNNHRIRARAAPTARCKIVAGVGRAGADARHDPATDRLNHPTDVTFDPQGRHGDRRLAQQPDQALDADDRRARSTSAAPAARAYTGDGGPAATAALNLPVGVVLDPAGNL